MCTINSLVFIARITLNRSMSSPKAEKSKKGLSIIAVSRRKKSKKEKSSPDSSSIGSQEFVGTEIHLQRPSSTSSSASVERERMAAEVADLARQLEEAQGEADMLRGQSVMDKEQISSLEARLQEAQKEMQQWKGKAAQYENVSAELDDESFDAAHEFQLKQQLEDMKKELETHDKVKEELTDTKQELAELRTQYEELELQTSRKSTRTDIARIRSEKATREEVERLHRELRQMERNIVSQTSLLEAQLKASKDSLQRAGEKAQALQRRLDLLDKEKMELKLENQKLTRKLEKTDSYEAKKRAQMEAETQELEIANLKRKTAKLEKRLSMSITNLDQIDEVGITSPTSSRLSSGTTSPVSMTLAEARVFNLEKEVNTLETKNTALTNESEALRDELFAAKQDATVLASQVEQLQAHLAEEKKELEEANSKLLEYQSNPPAPTTSAVEVVPTASGDEVAQELQQEVAKLKKALEDKETEMRVRLREMKATNEELKRQVEELEMEKLRAELGEDEEGEGGEELTDTEEDNTAISDAPASNDGEVKNLRERLLSLQDELQSVSQNNEELKTELQKQKTEAELFMQTIVSELSEVTESEETREQRLEKRNEELKAKVQEHQEKYSDAVKEIARLKNVISQQVMFTFQIPQSPVACFTLHRDTVCPH